jgi:hypothetical protein
MVQVMQLGGKGLLGHRSDRRSSGRSLATFVASAERLLTPRRKQVAACANLAQVDHNEAVGESTRIEGQANEAREVADMSPADRNDGLSLPVRVWLIVGAAGAFWALAALIFALLT